MDKFDRIYELHKTLKAHRYPVSLQSICDELECSPATSKRIIQQMRLFLDAPIINAKGKGYYYDSNISFELPGMWFNSSELYALLTIDAMLKELSNGLLGDAIGPMRNRIEKLIPQSDQDGLSRIRLLEVTSRLSTCNYFADVAEAVIKRIRLCIQYKGRGNNKMRDRSVSPQRLTHYRDNWYLDAFCHESNSLRTFSLERITSVEVLAEPCKNISDDILNKELASSYGIFAGKSTDIAVLHFNAFRASWIAEESWHPKQEGKWLNDNCYELRVPYSAPTELILDICRYGPDVEVIEPKSLRRATAERLENAASQYD